MKKVTLFLLVMLHFFFAQAQKVYFIYLQSDNHQPFYARIGEKVFNANASGYMVLSKLRDSTYSLNIGIDGYKEQLFSLTVNKKDQGFLLKNFGEDGWGLFDLQNLNVVKSQTKTSSNIVLNEKKEANSFNELLAKAADDSSLILKPVVIKSEEKNIENSGQISEGKGKSKSDISTTGSVKLEALEIKKMDSAELKTEDVKTKGENQNKDVVSVNDQDNEKKESDKLSKDLYLISTIVKHSESSTTEGFGLTFFDFLPNGTIDTISILIPEIIKSLTVPIKKEDKKFLNIDSASIELEKTNTLVIQKADSSDSAGKVPQKINNCSIVATEDDFLILKNKMSKGNNTENMINEAAVTFSTKCFTTAQIKNLSSLFTTDDGKYKLFDAAYLHVSDISNFSSLQSELKEDYFIRRFKAMLF